MRITSLISLLAIALFVSACGTGKKAARKPAAEEKPIARVEKPTPPDKPERTDSPSESTTPETPTSRKRTYVETVTSYIDNYKHIAKEEMLLYGIPASIKMAQAILESGAGLGKLSLRSNNHFGIKCQQGWTGESVRHDDDAPGECFRKYNDPKYSFRDHSLFLTGRSRYSDLFKLRKDDYKGWARGLKKAGYATDSKYPQKLIEIIETYKLYELDKEVLGGETNIVRPDTTRINTYTVKKGDTLYAIGRRFNLSVETLKRYNGLGSDDIRIGQVLYLNPR